MQLDLVARDTPLWRGASDLVRRTFAETFDADVTPQPDAFLIARPKPSDGHWSNATDEDADEVLACSGVNFGAGEPFFSECYLDGTAEEVISEHVGEPCERGDIVEFGAIASQQFSAGTEVLKAIPIFTWTLGKVYALCTLTRPLSRLVERIGYDFEPLAEAKVDRLPPEDRHRWGNYYEKEPRAGLVRLHDLAPFFNGSIGRYQLPELSVTIADDEADTSGANG
jgi:Thermostable hemolysin